ncbi:hypothetical protein BH10CYA1_BH10CYA1_54080 [soil metagenome]
MFRTKTETKLVWWPTPQDYNEAVQIPQVSLQDLDLKAGLPYTNALELPRSITGSFASVYRMHCKKRDFALRLFLSNINDQHERYALISDFVQHDSLPYTVTFDFLSEGIKIRGEWLPALKMDWLEGEQFDDYVVDNLANPAKLGQLLDEFVKMMREMRRAGIAHGDLQHGNILVCKNELRLVDYDGMFVPAMKGFSASELGHRNYQHPDRAAEHFGPYLDNFSAWIIYASVRALQIDSRLMHQLGGGDDCLLFRQADFMDPLHSAAFAAFEKHDDARLRELGRFVRAQLKKELHKIPYLELPVPPVPEQELHPVSQSAPVVKIGARLVRGNLPDWLQDDNAEVLSKAKLGHLDTASAKIDANLTDTSAPKLAPNAVSLSWTVPAKPAQQAVWLKPKEIAAQGKSNPSDQAQLQANANSPVPHLPPELHISTSVPRTVRWNPSCGHIHHRYLLALMILNPALWAMFNFGFNALGIDSQLASQGVMVPATITSVVMHPGKNGYSQVEYNYRFNNHIFVRSERRGLNAKTFSSPGYSMGKGSSPDFVGVLPSNPKVTEPLNRPLGSNRSEHLLYCCLCFLVNLFVLGAILYSPWKERHLAVSGHPLFAKIDALRTEHGSKGENYYKADLSFCWSGHDQCQTISVTETEYKLLVVGSTELILYNENYGTLSLYRFCRYHPIIGSTSLKP